MSSQPQERRNRLEARQAHIAKQKARITWVVIGFVVLLGAGLLFLLLSPHVNKTKQSAVIPETTSTVDPLQQDTSTTQTAQPDPAPKPENKWDSYYKAANEARYQAYASENPETPYELVVAFVNAGVDQMYINTEPTKNQSDISVLANKHYYLDESYVPSDLVDVGGGAKLRKEAAAKYLEMKDAMGMKIVADSTYRSYAEQKYAYNKCKNEFGLAVADREFARPGFSEHQTGLAVDILQAHFDPQGKAHFENTKQYAWLTEHAYEYGFIQRYRDGFNDITGYITEPWHWRYIGVEAATKMKTEGIATYEEYYGKYGETGL